jgi:hypothetical protein
MEEQIIQGQITEQIPVRRLSELMKFVFQGVLLSRYRNDTAPHRSLVNVSDLEHLYIEGDLALVQVTLPNSKHWLREGDVVVTLRGSDLKASVVTQAAVEGVAGQNLAVLRPGAEIYPLYLAVLLRSQWMRTKLSGLYMQSTGTQIIRLSQLVELPIPVPSLETQHKIARFFLALEKRNRLALEEISARQQLADSVLIHILRGKE